MPPVAGGRPRLSLSLFNHSTQGHYEELLQANLLERARKLAARARQKGLGSLKPSDDALIGIGMEVDDNGRVTKNSLGVLDLSWQAAEHPEWPEMIQGEVEEIRARIRSAHGVELRNLIWAGMGGSAEDKSMYNALGLLEGGVAVYILDSTDPAKLQAILADIGRRCGPPAQALRQTLVVGMAMGMTSYEPVINLEKLDLLFRKHNIPSQANFLYMTLPGSLLDQFAGRRAYRRIELQPDNDNTTAGRHSGPLTRGSFYPLALNRVDLKAWMSAAVLTDAEIERAFELAAFLHGNGVQGRDKVSLLLPREWTGAGVWSKQDFEESLGKSEQLGIKIFPAQSPRRRAPDQVYVAVTVPGCANPDGAAWKALRAAGYPAAVVDLRARPALPFYMQWLHYAVFALGWLRQMNFVTQPSVELYKQITGRLYAQAKRAGAVEDTAPWRALVSSPYRATAPGGVVLHYDSLLSAGLLQPQEAADNRRDAVEIFARAVGRLAAQKKVEYAELTFYGDTRYRPEGRRCRALLVRAAESLFGDCLGMSTDVYEGPAMNHSYHEMIIGHGRCFSTVLLARRQAALRSLGYRADYHKAQWLATKLALERRRRAVVGITFPDLSAASRRALGNFFRRVARRLHLFPAAPRNATI